MGFSRFLCNTDHFVIDEHHVVVLGEFIVTAAHGFANFVRGNHDDLFLRVGRSVVFGPGRFPDSGRPADKD